MRKGINHKKSQNMNVTNFPTMLGQKVPIVWRFLGCVCLNRNLRALCELFRKVYVVASLDNKTQMNNFPEERITF